jgi:hypothetical protein
MADEQMIEERRRTWKGFHHLLTYSAAAALAILALMALFLV